MPTSWPRKPKACRPSSIVVSLFSGAGFRGNVRLLSHDDGSIAPKVTLVTAIEGNWEYFVRFVQLSEA